MKIYIDDDLHIGYEKNSFLKSVFNHFFIPILNNIPPSSQRIIKRSHHSAKKIIETATTHEAIETLYKFGEPENSKTFLQKFFHYVWFSTDNPKAVRNRLRLVTRELKRAIKDLLLQERKVKILSIAAGSARAVLDAISIDDLKSKRPSIIVTFLDKNPEANKYSQQLVSGRNYPYDYQFRWIVDTANNFPLHFKKDDKANIIEIVGLLDYFENDAVEKLFRSVFNGLEDGGTFITSNIVDNRERKFVTKVAGWKMIYKKPEDFFEIAKKVGFKPYNITILYEPLRIHFVMIAKK